MDYVDEESLFHFGTPLDPLEEDDIPKKRITVEDQIVTDENGRRRFHGAFTGGFSAGFWNTVGSLEGWKPKSFKSSRTEKAETQICQQPKDFMDDEDLGEFGIAPQRVQAKDDFTKIDSNNRKRMVNNINGFKDQLAPILQDMLEPPKAKVALRLLMEMGWKPGQGIGARQTRKEKALAKKRNDRELYVIQKYGYEIEASQNATSMNSVESEDSSEDENDFQITFAPDDIEQFECCSKDNVFGLGYSGLGESIRSKASSHINLFGPLEVLGRDSKKLSIRGQAFGVGALEEEDEDIYAKDDMSQYDFCLSDKKKLDKKKTITNQKQRTLEGFETNNKKNERKSAFTIKLDDNFQPKNWLQRKTRFSKLTDIEIENITQNNEHKKKGIARHDIGVDERGKILCHPTAKSDNENPVHIYEKNAKDLKGIGSIRSTIFKKEDISYIWGKDGKSSHSATVIKPKYISKTNESPKTITNDVQAFKPFAPNIEKQDRYEKFIAANLKNEEDIQKFLGTIQPIHLSAWDREMERKEFIQAQHIYKPLDGLMSERFVSNNFLNDSLLFDAKIEEQCDKKCINVQRTKLTWKPCSLICKRFNIPEPFSGVITEPKTEKKGKFSIFDYIENSLNSKKDFVTPVIIPKHIERPRESQGNSSVDLNKIMSLQNIPIPDSTTWVSKSLNSSMQLLTKTTKGPKSQLEIKIEDYKHKHPSEKKDLFKSIFDSCSESDSESNTTNSDTEVGPKISSEIVDKLLKPSAPSKNILKNNSPPRGIFASLLSPPTRKVEAKSIQNIEYKSGENIVFKSAHERECTRVLELEDMYGPKLPQSLSATDWKTSKEKDCDNKIMELLSARPSIKYIEKWVEKKHSSKNRHKKNLIKTSKQKKKKKKKKNDD